VVHDLATSLQSAASRTRIFALVADASLVLRTFSTDDTFRSAVGRCSDVALDAGADSVAVGDSADAVASARIRLARIDRSDSCI